MKTRYLLTLALTLPLAAEVLPPTEDIPMGTTATQEAAAALHIETREMGYYNLDTIGRAGMGAVKLRLKQADGSCSSCFLAFGGANFPNALPNAKTPEERGAKVFYDEYGLIMPPVKGSFGDYARSGKLPYPVGYAAAAAVPAKDTAGEVTSFVIAGGCNADGHLAKTVAVKLCGGAKVETTPLPDLPVSCAYPAYATLGNHLYVIGGQEKPDSTEALHRMFRLDMTAPAAGWRELAPMPGAGRMLSVAGVEKGKLYLTGGCSLHADAQGKPERTYLKETLVYDPDTNSWSKAADAPETIVGAATPMPNMAGRLLLVGGDPGHYYRAALNGQAPANHPGQARAVYAFNPALNAWTKAGELPLGVATFPAVQLGPGSSSAFTISGETHPGVRTPKIFHIHIIVNK